MTVAFPLVGDTLGGAQRSTLELAKALAEQTELKIHVVLHENNEQIRRKLDGSGVSLSLLPSSNFLGPPRFGFRSRWCAGRDVVRVAFWCRKNLVDIVHTNDRRCHRIWGQGGSLGRAKWILHRRKMGNPPFAPKLLRKADRVIAISESCRHSITRVPADRVSLIYNAVEAPAFFERSREFNKNGTVRLLFLGNVIARKRFDLFARLAEALHQRKPNRYEFHVAGRDAIGLAEESLAELSETVRRQFVVHGEVPDPWPLLGETDILIAPAVDEAFGRTLVEAQLAGVLVIASRDGGHEEIVNHLETGFLARPDSIGDFIKWIEYICESSKNDEIESLLAKAQAQARARFSVNRLAHEVAAVYHEAIKKS